MPDIKVKGYSGNDLVYEDVEKIYFQSATGSEKLPFSYGEAVDNIPISLDLANGDQTISAPEGTLVRSAVIVKPAGLKPENIRNGENVGGVVGQFIGDTEEAVVDLNMANGDQVIMPSADGKVLSKVTIEKPETLIPENIMEGIDIGGIIGTLAPGGSTKIAFGAPYFSGQTSAVTITHGLGVVPDVVIVLGYGLKGSTTKLAVYYQGVSSAFATKYLAGSNVASNFMVYRGASTTPTFSASYGGIDDTQYTNAIHGATDTIFKLAASSSYKVDGSYWWVAIGGLT